jgi:hypothetical protein
MEPAGGDFGLVPAVELAPSPRVGFGWGADAWVEEIEARRSLGSSIGPFEASGIAWLVFSMIPEAPPEDGAGLGGGVAEDFMSAESAKTTLVTEGSGSVGWCERAGADDWLLIARESAW